MFTYIENFLGANASLSGGLGENIIGPFLNTGLNKNFFQLLQLPVKIFWLVKLYLNVLSNETSLGKYTCSRNRPVSHAHQWDTTFPRPSNTAGPVQVCISELSEKWPGFIIDYFKRQLQNFFL